MTIEGLSPHIGPHILAEASDWRGMAGMRDRLIHAYFGVDYELVWEVVTKHVPALNEQLAHLLEDDARS